MSVRLQVWLLVFFFSALGLIAYASRTPTSAQETSAPVAQVTPPPPVSVSRAPANAVSREPSTRVVDESGYLDANLKWHLDSFLQSTFHESGVDIRFIFVSEPLASIEDYARMRAREMGVGQAVDRRGALFVYDVRGQRMRAEVGPGLEGIFTDGFLGYLMREQAAAFFAAGDKNLALKSMLGIVSFRLREAALNEAYDPRRITWITDGQRLASGAGATARVADGHDDSMLQRTTLTGDAAAYFGPQPTVALVRDRYLEAMRTGNLQPDLALYARGSEYVLRRFPVAPPYAQFIVYAEFWQKYRIVERGDRAILYYTTTPFVSPHLFRHSSAGWQLDLASEVFETRERIGGAFTWEMLRGGEHFAAFEDLFDRYDGLLRTKDGDNRRLPVLGHLN
jgi:hypothetical protein